MATLETRLRLAFTRVGSDTKAIRALLGNLPSLTTSEKATLVGAINEVNAKTASAGAAIDDATPRTTTVYSSTKTNTAIAAATAALKSELLNGATAEYDSFKEIQDFLAGLNNTDTAYATALANRVRVDAAQTFTAAQKAQAGANMGSAQLVDTGVLDTDFVAVYETAIA